MSLRAINGSVRLSTLTGWRSRWELLRDGNEGSLWKDLLGAAHAPGCVDLIVGFHDSLQRRNGK